MRSRKAFTLIELIIYVSIASMILLGMVTFTWDIIGTEARVDISTELTQNTRLIMEKFTQAVHSAESIDTENSTFGSSPGVLALNDIVFDTYEETITIGGQETTITKLRMQEGMNPAVDVSNNKVTINNLVFTDLSREGDSKNVKLDMELEYSNQSGDFPWNTTLTIETSATLRER